jgi:hypothetical protein
MLKTLRINKEKIQSDVCNFYKGEEVSLYNYWLTSSDFLNYGHVILIPKKLIIAKTFTQLFDYVDLLVRSNYTGDDMYFRRLLYDDRCKFATNKSISPFNGEFPRLSNIDNIPFQEVNPMKYSIIELIACGFCEKLNPNLISSLGYVIST